MEFVMSNDNGNSLEGSFGYSEVSATWATRYLDASGFACMLSIQAETGAEALSKAESALKHLTDAKCLPYHRDSHNGNGQGNGHKPGATVMVKPDGNSENPTCPIHNIEMQKWSKNGRTWYSHKLEEGGGWCNGKRS